MIKVNVRLDGDIRYYELRFLGILIYKSQRPFEIWSDRYIIY